MKNEFLENAFIDYRKLDSLRVQQTEVRVQQAQQQAKAPSIERLVSLFESLDTRMNGYLTPMDIRVFFENFDIFKQECEKKQNWMSATPNQPAESKEQGAA